MKHFVILLAAAAVSLSAACASKVETERKVEAREANEEGAGDEESRYREREGSPYLSAEQADEQLEGD
ncbi:MAG: hypothetical protein WBN38_00095 [Polyangiales bacterium]